MQQGTVILIVVCVIAVMLAAALVLLLRKKGTEGDREQLLLLAQALRETRNDIDKMERGLTAGNETVKSNVTAEIGRAHV